MIPQKRSTNNDHEHAVQHQQVHLTPHQHGIPAQGVLDHAEQRADQDERAGHVQGPEELAPGDGDGVGFGRGVGGDAHVEENGGDDEEPEEEDLDAQPAQDDVVAEVLVFGGGSFGEDAAACFSCLLAC